MEVVKMSRARRPANRLESLPFIIGVGGFGALFALLAILTYREGVGESNLWPTVYSLVAAPFVVLFIALLAREIRKEQETRLNRVVARAVRQGVELAGTPSLSAQKRELLLSMGPQTYYYLDSHQIEELYGQITTEPSSIEVEEQRSRSTGIAAKLHFLEPRHDRGSTVRRLEKYEANKTVSQKYQLIQREMLTRRELVTFGIEDFEYDSDAVREVRSALENVELPEPLFREILSEVSMRKKLEAAHRKRDELKSVSGFVATHADYVARWHTERECSLYLQHPLNDYLQGEHPEVVIKIVCNPDFVTPSGRDAFIDGALIRITCLGKVIRWHSQSRHLVISPIGIS